MHATRVQKCVSAEFLQKRNSVKLQKTSTHKLNFVFIFISFINKIEFLDKELEFYSDKSTMI